MNKKLLFGYPIVLFLYSIYSFSQTAPNLVLSSNSLYWQFQQYMWQLGYHMRPLSSALFVLLIVASFLFYVLALYLVKTKQLSLKNVLLVFGLCVMALIPSYPALSNDIYNYLMNAKIMHVYHASPYQHAAWDFPGDPWLEFMMNVHTTTPYGYIWTGIGYMTYLAGFGDLQFGMLAFRMLAVIAVGVIGWSIWKLAGKNRLELLTYFLLNPLILFEAINNAHNDITMMAFFMAGVAVWQLLKNTRKLLALVLLIGMWLLSVFTKLITVIAPGIVAGTLIIRRWIPWFNWADWMTFASIAIMYTDGSKRFFTWYLLWAACVAPLAQSKFSRNLVIAFSLSGMLSYVFFLYSGEYNAYWGMVRISFLFVVPFIFSLVYGFHHRTSILKAIGTKQ